jgi:catechol 2,3-dioxygenase-like lactoylglutathione lyase family enzyme
MPLSRISTTDAVSVTRAGGGASVAGDVREAFTHGPAEQLLVGGVDHVGGRREVSRHARRPQELSASGELGGEGRFPVARHGSAHLGERLAGEVFDLGDLSRRPLAVGHTDPASEACLHRDRGEGVPEQVMEVTGDPGALALCREPSDLGSRFGECPVASLQRDDPVGDDGDDRDGEGCHVVERGGEAVVPRRDGDGHVTCGTFAARAAPATDVKVRSHPGGGVVMEVRAVDHVQLAMPPGREEDARAFYGALLSIDERPKPEHLALRGGCWFERGAVKIHLGAERDFRPARKAHPALLVDDLPALVAKLEAAGVEVRDEEPLPGYQRVYVDDPFGNRIELLEPHPGFNHRPD